MDRPCRLCEALSPPGNAARENTVLIESERFVVMPTLGQFIEGWLMVVSKDHIRCAREHPTHELEELDDLVAQTKALVKSYYGPAVVFEHGPSDIPGLHGGCCIEHTHIHVVPCANGQEFCGRIVFRRVGDCTISDLSRSMPDKSRGYLIAGSDMASRRLNLYEVDCPSPRQYLRQVLAVVCNKNTLWDWRQKPCLENIHKTLLRLDAKNIRGTNFTRRERVAL
jgi:ATP adenylyltransferase